MQKKNPQRERIQEANLTQDFNDAELALLLASVNNEHVKDEFMLNEEKVNLTLIKRKKYQANQKYGALTIEPATT